jgi:hypothetical protein
VDSLAREGYRKRKYRGMKDLFMLTKKISGQSQETWKPGKDKDGNSLTTTEDSYTFQFLSRRILLRTLPVTDSSMIPR